MPLFPARLLLATALFCALFASAALAKDKAQGNAPHNATEADQTIPGICFEAQQAKEHAQAVTLWTECLEAESGAKPNAKTRGIALYNRGLAHMGLNEPRKAIEDYTEAAKDLRLDADVYINRGYAYLQLNDLDNAHSDFSRAIALNPQSAEAYVNRAAANSAKGNEEEAVYDLEQALKKDPANLSALRGLGTLLSMSEEKETRDGIRAVEVALRLVALERDWRSMEILAAAHAEAGQFSQAVAAQEEALALAEAAAESTAVLKDNLERYRREKKYK